jgi:Prokaryotic cytochrome b561
MARKLVCGEHKRFDDFFGRCRSDKIAGIRIHAGIKTNRDRSNSYRRASGSLAAFVQHGGSIMTVQTLSSPVSYTRTAYTRTAKILHWLVALFILTNFAIGLRMEHFPGYGHKSPEWNDILFWHGSIGALVLWLAVARLIWRRAIVRRRCRALFRPGKSGRRTQSMRCFMWRCWRYRSQAMPIVWPATTR